MQLVDAFVTNRTSAKTLADGLRNGIRAMAEHYGFDYHDRLEWLVADKIDELISENKKLQAECDAAVEDIIIACRGERTLCGMCGNKNCEYAGDNQTYCYKCTKYKWRGIK